MSEITALLLWQVALGVRAFLCVFAGLFGFVAIFAFMGLGSDEEKEVQLSLLNTAIRNTVSFAICISLATMIPGKDWFLTLVGGAR